MKGRRALTLGAFHACSAIVKALPWPMAISRGWQESRRSQGHSLKLLAEQSILPAVASPWPSAQPPLEAVTNVASPLPPGGIGLNERCASLKADFEFSETPPP